MGAKEFGQQVEAKRQELGWTRSKVAVAVGILPDGTVLDATQIRRVVEGTRQLDENIIRRLIEVLDLDPYEAWPAAGILPRRVSPQHLRQLDELLLRSGSTRVICGYCVSAGQRLHIPTIIPLRPRPVPARVLERAA